MRAPCHCRSLPLCDSTLYNLQQAIGDEEDQLKMATPGPMNPDAVVAQAKRLINTQLKAVLKSCNLPVSGAKAALQQRIINGIWRSSVTLSFSQDL